MNCRDAQRLVPKYINRELGRGEQDEFLNHVMNCSECYEELELFYTLHVGLAELAGEAEGVYNLKSVIEQAMNNSRTEMIRQRVRWDIYYASSTVLFWVISAAVIIQLRLLYEYALSAGWLALLG